MTRIHFHLILIALTPFLSSGDSVRLPGTQLDGSVLLHNQWSIRPVGRQVQLGTLPDNVAIHPKGKFAAVLDCG
jgi:hypothetical protein